MARAFWHSWLALLWAVVLPLFFALMYDIVSLYELTGALSLAQNSESNWRPFKIEGYLFIALIYFVFCFSISRYSIWVKKQVNRGKQRWAVSCT